MSWIESYQNIANLVVCTGVSATLYAYYNISEEYLNYAIPLIIIHFTSDLFITTKKDIQLHHLVGLIFIVYKYMMNVETIDTKSTILVLYKTEISTFFYVFKIILQNMKNKNELLIQLNDIFFIITFFKFRMYDFYNILINDMSIYIIYMKYNYFCIIISAVHCMYLLNVYWFLIICKIIAKPFIKLLSPQFTEYICHYITAYTMFISLFITLYYYSLQFNNRYLYSIFGVAALTISSYKYNKYAYTLIGNYKELCYTSQETIFLFLQVVGCIHLYSFLVLLTNYDFINIVYISAFLHVVFYSINIAHIYYLYNTKKNLYKNNNHYNIFILIQYLFIGLPCILDLFLITLNSINSEYSIHGIYITFLMVLFCLTKPFYDLTHVAFHICLIIQAYCCTNCNIYSIQHNFTSLDNLHPFQNK
jgi:hypothetical protein